MIIPASVKKKLRGKRLKKFPRAVPPKGIEREYERALLPYLRALHTLINHFVTSRLQEWSKEAYFHRDDADDIDDGFDDVRIELERLFTEDEIRNIAFNKGMSVAELNQSILENGFKSVLGIDLVQGEPWLQKELLMFAASNANLITKIGDDTINKVHSLVFDGFRQGLRWEDIADDIQELTDPESGFSRKRARLVARDQVNKLNGQLTGLRQQKLGIETYTWRTMLDERVREDHAIKEGEVFSWDDPPEDTGHPGEDIQCRCYAEPNLDDLLDEDTDDDDDE
jgi:SPP1 gp7 family putative phage head morphogenesis protein